MKHGFTRLTGSSGLTDRASLDSDLMLEPADDIVVIGLLRYAAVRDKHKAMVHRILNSTLCTMQGLVWSWRQRRHVGCGLTPLLCGRHWLLPVVWTKAKLLRKRHIAQGPSVHNVSQRRQSKTRPRPQLHTHRTFGEFAPLLRGKVNSIQQENAIIYLCTPRNKLSTATF